MLIWSLSDLRKSFIKRVLKWTGLVWIMPVQ